MLALASIEVQAQQQEFKPSVGIGVRGGLNFSTVIFEPTINQSSVQGYSGGFLINYYAERNVGLQLEFNYNQLGWKYGIKDDGISIFDYERQIESYQINLLTNIYIGKKTVRPVLDLGPYIAFHQGYSEKYLLGSAPEIEASDEIPLGEPQFFGKDIDNKFDLGFNVSLGVGVYTPVGQFLIKGRFCKGLNNIFGEYPLEGNFRTSSFQTFSLDVSYTYPIKFKKVQREIVLKK